MATALSLCSEGESAHLEHLRGSMEQRLRDRYADCVIHGLGAPRATHVTSVAFPGASGPALAAALDARGIQVGAGSACHSGGGSVSSHTLRAMQVEPRVAGGTLRISLGWNTAEEHVDEFLGALDMVLATAAAGS
jgi:cysteine desulfurase